MKLFYDSEHKNLPLESEEPVVFGILYWGLNTTEFSYRTTTQLSFCTFLLREGLPKLLKTLVNCLGGPRTCNLPISPLRIKRIRDINEFISISMMSHLNL